MFARRVRSNTFFGASSIRLALRRCRLAGHTALRRCQSNGVQAHSYTTLPPDYGSLRYENFYERLLKVYGTAEGRVSVSKFLQVKN